MAGFADATSKWAKKAHKNVDVVMQKTAFELFKRVILRTPVDTGRARANWGVTIAKPRLDSPAEPNVTYVDENGQAAVGKAAEEVFRWEPEKQESIFLTNNVPYIGALEYGHSQQAPAGMVRVVVEEFDGIVINAANFSINVKG